MYIVRVLYLSGNEKEFEFADENCAKAAYAGIDRLRNIANVVTLELFKRGA